MTVNRGQIKAMSDIIAKLNFNDDEPAQQPQAQSLFTESAAPQRQQRNEAVTIDTSASLTEMSNIMSRFRAATEGVREEAQTNDALLEALQTERTPTGVRIAEWKINITEAANKPGKFYDVTRDDIKIATDLRLYEAAHMLCRELNNGASITSSKIRKLLALEAQYASSFEDAIRYSGAVKASTGVKRDIAMTKLDEAKTKALSAKDQLKEIR